MSESFKTSIGSVRHDLRMSPTQRTRTASSSRSDLTDLMNVGQAVAGYFQRAGITRISELAGRDPVEIYEDMCEADGQRLDPCLLDTVMSAVDQADGKPARPWWSYTAHRKQLLDQ
ncbi:helix-hairpin-helix domain-containing protein [Kribbella sp. NBC_00889]|uniref:helix-hairpin-helix domain-containing protein n=1 Tax=Kribbella sp. NBC_00889 TaxID=2975974 RepID=UPI00386CDFF3